MNDLAAIKRIRRYNYQTSNLSISSIAKVAELVDAPDLGSGAERCGGSSPPFRTKRLVLLVEQFYSLQTHKNYMLLS